MAPTKKSTSLISNRLYDILKHLTQITLPAVGTLYFAVSQIWGLPEGAEVVGTITAIDAFLGVALGFSTRAYNKSEAKFDGSIVVEHQEDKKLFSLQLDSDPDELDKKAEVIFKVTKVESEPPVKRVRKKPTV